MGMDNIFGASVNSFLLITVFWIMIFSIIFGLDGLGDGAVGVILCFFVIGTTFLVGTFGWYILVIPSLAIIVGAGIALWRFISG